jgi:hypothetical protein
MFSTMRPDEATERFAPTHTPSTRDKDEPSRVKDITDIELPNKPLSVTERLEKRTAAPCKEISLPARLVLLVDKVLKSVTESNTDTFEPNSAIDITDRVL